MHAGRHLLCPALVETMTDYNIEVDTSDYQQLCEAADALKKLRHCRHPQRPEGLQ